MALNRSIFKKKYTLTDTCDDETAESHKGKKEISQIWREKIIYQEITQVKICMLLDPTDAYEVFGKIGKSHDQSFEKQSPISWKCHTVSDDARNIYWGWTFSFAVTRP